MNPDASYIECCIQALPLERREAARQAFQEISEDGTGTFLGKFLVLLDASGTYAKTIPQELKSVADSLLRDLESIHSRDAAQSSADQEHRENHFRQILAEQMPILAKGLAVTRLAEGLEAQKAIIGRLEHAVSTMRYLRVGGLLLLMGLSALVGAGAMGGFFYQSYQEGQQSRAWLDDFSRHGITIQAHETQNTVNLTVEGREDLLQGTDYRKDRQGLIKGIDLVYPK